MPPREFIDIALQVPIWVDTDEASVNFNSGTRSVLRARLRAPLFSRNPAMLVGALHHLRHD